MRILFLLFLLSFVSCTKSDDDIPQPSHNRIDTLMVLPSSTLKPLDQVNIQDSIQVNTQDSIRKDSCSK